MVSFDNPMLGQSSVEILRRSRDYNSLLKVMGVSAQDELPSLVVLNFVVSRLLDIPESLLCDLRCKLIFTV